MIHYTKSEKDLVDFLRKETFLLKKHVRKIVWERGLLRLFLKSNKNT
jgi:hypothetical protein